MNEKKKIPLPLGHMAKTFLLGYEKGREVQKKEDIAEFLGEIEYIMDMIEGKMLFDFTVKKENYEELKNHMIEHLEKFKI